MELGYSSRTMTLRSVFHLGLTLALFTSAQAQLAATLRVNKRQYLAGEPVMAVVTVTNHAGQNLTFAGDGRNQWLNFVVKDSKGNPVNSKGRAIFGKMTVKAGQTMAREVDLSEHFKLDQPGGFSTSAVIRMPGSVGDGTSTNRVTFNQSPGRLFWSQTVGIAGGSGETRQFRILNFSGDLRNQIYAQIRNERTGQYVRTFLLGDVLTLREPLATVDNKQRMHVMFLATPTMWVHCEVDTDGRLVNRGIHQRASSGDPRLVTLSDGSVRVSNSIRYDPKLAAESKAKIRKASDRPPIAY